MWQLISAIFSTKKLFLSIQISSLKNKMQSSNSFKFHSILILINTWPFHDGGHYHIETSPLCLRMKRITESFDIHETLAFALPFPWFLGPVFQTCPVQHLLQLCLELLLKTHVCWSILVELVEPLYGEPLQALMFCVNLDDHLVHHPLHMNCEFDFSHLQGHLLHRNQMKKHFFA